MDKNVLKKFAIESRQELMEKVANKINRYFVDEEFNVNQNGEVYVLVNDKHTLRLTKSEYENRQLLVKRIKEITLEQVIEEAAYTWFNRIIAIRYMEIHDYLPLTKDNQSLGVRVLSSKDNTPDPEIMKISNLINPDLDIEFNKEYYGTIQDNNKRFEYILLLVCKKLGKVIPQVFDGVTDYIDILIPDNLLNDSGYVTKLLNDVAEENYDEVEIIGWLYQFYNTENNNLVYDGNMSKNRIPKELVPAATQIFTPNWVVRYMIENTLMLKLESEFGKVENIFEYSLNLKCQKQNQKIESISFLDPCCGSGHILVYAFQVFYKYYEKLGYKKEEIPSIILNNNIYGLEIDERAAQLSILALLLKAREYDKKLFSKNINLNIFDIKETNNITDNEISFLTDEGKNVAVELVNCYLDAKEYGSLIKTSPKDYNILKNEIINTNSIFMIDLKNKLIPIIQQDEVLNKKFDVIVTNPPYLNSSRFSTKLNEYMSKNYDISKSDLSMAILEKSIKDFCNQNGLISFVTTTSWMYLKNFDKIRKYLLDNISITSLVDFGTELFDGKVGHNPIVSWTMQKNMDFNDFIAIKLSEFCYSRRNEKRKEFFNEENRFFINQKDILKISGYPLAYWIDNQMIEDIKIGFSIEKISDFTGGQHKTADNDKYLRFFWEIENTKFGEGKKWIYYAKGGEYRKYYGNLEYVVDWSPEALYFYKNNKTSNLIDEHYWYKEGITFTKITSKGSSFRYLPPIGVFDMGGPSLIEVKDLYYCLGLLNSKIADDFFRMINPTINLQNKDVKAFPILMPSEESEKLEIENIVKKCIDISKEDWDSFENSWDFKLHPLVKNIKNNINEKGNNKIKDCYEIWSNQCNVRFEQMKHYERILNEKFKRIYKLNHISNEIEDKDITIRKADREREIKSLISYAVGCMFGRYSLNKEGLVYAGGKFEDTFEKYKRQNLVDEKGQPLPGNNGDWAGISLAEYKYISDEGKEIELSYSPDIDNIIPLTEENYFGDDIVARFRKFIEVVYGKETLYENLDFIAETLGKRNGENSEETIRRYFINDFYNDHVKMYQKRPIYWLFDSGKKNGFKCLIYMHRYNEGLVSKIRLDYLHRMQNTYEKELKEITGKLNNDVDLTSKRELSKRQADISAKLQETNEYDEKIAHIADQKIKIDLDDGVVVNYAKFSVKNPKTGKDESILAKIK